MKSEKKIKTVKDLKNFIKNFDDSTELSEICIKQIKPNKFGIEIYCDIILNADNNDEASDMINQQLLNAFGRQKIEIGRIECSIKD